MVLASRHSCDKEEVELQWRCVDKKAPISFRLDTIRIDVREGSIMRGDVSLSGVGGPYSPARTLRLICHRHPHLTNPSTAARHVIGITSPVQPRILIASLDYYVLSRIAIHYPSAWAVASEE